MCACILPRAGLAPAGTVLLSRAPCCCAHVAARRTDCVACGRLAQWAWRCFRVFVAASAFAPRRLRPYRSVRACAPRLMARGAPSRMRFALARAPLRACPAVAWCVLLPRAPRSWPPRAAPRACIRRACASRLAAARAAPSGLLLPLRLGACVLRPGAERRCSSRSRPLPRGMHVPSPVALGGVHRRPRAATSAACVQDVASLAASLAWIVCWAHGVMHAIQCCARC